MLIFQDFRSRRLARVTCHVPYFLPNVFNHLRDSKSILGPQFGLTLVHSFVDRLSSTLVPRVELVLTMFSYTEESSIVQTRTF